MRTFALILSVTLWCSIYAQKPLFLRVYDQKEHKIYKGHIVRVTDTSILLSRGSDSNHIHVRNIGSVKTKRAPGHNIAIGIAAGAITGTIVALAIDKPGTSELSLDDPDSPDDTILVGAIVGAQLGCLAGAITAKAKHSKRFVIDGDLAKWKAFQLAIVENNAK